MIITPYRHNIYSGSSSPAFSIAKSFYFDGVDEYFTIPKADLDEDIFGNSAGVKQFSINVTFKPVQENKFFGLFGLTFGTNRMFDFAVRDTNDLRFLYGGSGVMVSNELVNPNQWNTATIVWDSATSSNCYIMLNGVKCTNQTLTHSGGIASTNASFVYKIGWFSASYANGYIQQVSVVDRLQTETESQKLYNNGQPKNPQQLFGTNCKYFFNADNSGDTAQFSVVDSVNSITATSSNMEDADKTPITPYADPISTLVNKYSFINAWGFENQSIDGTTSTLTDYKAIHDLSNPAVANQWTFIGGDANLNNRASGYFVTDDYAYKSVANYNSGASTGSVHAVFTTNADVTSTQGIFCSCDESTTAYQVLLIISLGKIKVNFRNTTASGTRYEVTCDTTPMSINTSYAVSVYQNGSTLQILINGVAQSLTVSNGTAETYWFADIPNRDNISIGAIIQSSIIYSDIEIAFIGVSDDFADATVLATNNELKTIFGI